VCVKCDESCATCVDNGDKGDKMKCKTCSKKYPFLYSPDEKCLQSCYEGFYQINSQNCDKCDSSCLGCSGDKFNCTSCSVTAEKNLL
jgi:proprotein convertase subtilisin/kexin type 5